jgi:FAS-associated factor 2
MSDSEHEQQDLSQLDDSNASEEEDIYIPFDDEPIQFENTRTSSIHTSAFSDFGNNSGRNVLPTTNNFSQHTQDKPGVLAGIQSEHLVRDLNTISVNKEFVEEFEQKYGTLHPSFLHGSFNSALEKAKQLQKLVIVYIHTEATEGLNILLEETVADFIDMNFLFWVGNYVKPSPQIDNIIRGMSPPIMAVVGIDGYGNTNVVEILHGIDNVDILISRLMIIQDNFILAKQVASREKSKLNEILEQDRLLKLEQEQALLISQEQDKRKQEEEEIIRQSILEHEQRQKEEKEKRENDVLEKQKQLPAEPVDPKQSTDVIFRLPDGRRLQRKFHRNDTVETLYTYVDVSCPQYYVEGAGFELVVSFPKKNLTDRQQTLTAAGLVPQAMIHVQLL